MRLGSSFTGINVAKDYLDVTAQPPVDYWYVTHDAAGLAGLVVIGGQQRPDTFQ